jgi:hypothetical protein
MTRGERDYSGSDPFSRMINAQIEMGMQTGMTETQAMRGILRQHPFLLMARGIEIIDNMPGMEDLYVHLLGEVRRSPIKKVVPLAVVSRSGAVKDIAIEQLVQMTMADRYHNEWEDKRGVETKFATVPFSTCADIAKIVNIVDKSKAHGGYDDSDYANISEFMWQVVVHFCKYYIDSDDNNPVVLIVQPSAPTTDLVPHSRARADNRNRHGEFIVPSFERKLVSGGPDRGISVVYKLALWDFTSRYLHVVASEKDPRVAQDALEFRKAMSTATPETFDEICRQFDVVFHKQISALEMSFVEGTEDTEPLTHEDKVKLIDYIKRNSNSPAGIERSDHEQAELLSRLGLETEDDLFERYRVTMRIPHSRFLKTSNEWKGGHKHRYPLALARMNIVHEIAAELYPEYKEEILAARIT